MGCAASRINKEERVQVCKERKRLMKHLVGLRGEFADAQFTYLRALKNTGVTLRQFTESESLELENTSYGVALPPSPPPTLPPSPPPLPFSPDLTKLDTNRKRVINEEESTEIYEDGICATHPLDPTLTYGSWDPFAYLSPMDHHSEDTEVVEQVEPNGKEVTQQVEEENWAETKSEFEDEGDENAVGGIEVSRHHHEVVGSTDVTMHPLEVVSANDVKKDNGKLQSGELVDDDSSTISWYAKDGEDMPIFDYRGKKTLEGIVRELDDYFLKASACEKEIAIFIDISSGDTTLPQNFKENKRKRSNSAKVFSALSWSWSSKSLQFARDTRECNSSEPCRPGAHCSTLEKLYAAERKLYEEVKTEEITKIEHGRKSTLLQKQDEENQDWTKMEKIRSCVESLEADVRRLQDSISMTCSSIRKLIDEELYPQLVALTSGLGHMWKTMYKCHQVQSHISQKLNHLTDCPSMDLSSEYRRQAAAQLETEVTFWYSSFCKLVKSQQEYVRTLCKWIRLTECLVAQDQQQSSCSTTVRKLCEEWQLVSGSLPDKAASEAIKSFSVAIQSIIQQQAEEHSLHRKFEKLERRLQKELHSLGEMESKLEWDLPAEDPTSVNLSSKHPLSVKRVKTEDLKKRLDIEKAKYLNSVQVTKTMTLNNLKTSLPNVFQALAAFAGAYARGFEAVHGHRVPDVCDDASPTEETTTGSSV